MIHGFVVGNVIIGVLLSLVSGLFFWMMHIPYAVFLDRSADSSAWFPTSVWCSPSLLHCRGTRAVSRRLGPLVVILAGVVLCI